MHLYPHQSHGWDPVAWLIQALTRLRTGLMRHIDAPLTVQLPGVTGAPIRKPGQ